MTADTANKFFVSRRGEEVIILAFRAKMTRDEAIALAAWLVVMADDQDNFTEALETVKNT